MSSSLLMGDIDVVFSDAQLVPEAASTANTEARIVNNGKNIEISVDNAYPGYSATLNYEITNKGSVPVSCQLIEEGGADIPIKITGDLRYIKGDGGKASGHFTISVEESFDISGGCALNTELNFQQAVVEVR